MLLRRLSQSLKDQNWTAIIIEFVLLVSGVFLGIQVANWNQTRRDVALGDEYIGRLGRDFAVIDARLIDNIATWEQKAAAPVRVLADLEAFRRDGRWPRPKAAILADLDNTFDSRIPAPRAATYIELLSAGQLGLILDTKLRDALTGYDMQVGYTQTAYNVLMQRVEPHMPTLVSHLEFDRRSKPFDPKLTKPNTESWIDVDLAQLAADPGLKVALNMYSSASANQLFVARLQQQKARAVSAILPLGTSPAGNRQP